MNQQQQQQQQQQSILAQPFALAPRPTDFLNPAVNGQAVYARARDITVSGASYGGSITLHALIASQAASGSFSLTTQQMGGLSVSLDSQLIFRDVPALLPNLVTPIDTNDLCHTLMVVVYIKQQYTQDKELWELVVGKAERWVAKQIDDDEATNSIWELARKAWKVSNSVGVPAVKSL